MKPRLGVALLASCLSLATRAHADSLYGVRSELLRETEHRIRVTLAPSHATLRVQRSVFNGGAHADLASFAIDLPETAVATGLATLGTRDGQPFWFPGELLEAEAAAAKFRELTGYGGHYPKDPALLSWRSQQELVLEVFPCPAAATKSVAYTLEMPTRLSMRAGRSGSERGQGLSLPLQAAIIESNWAWRSWLFASGVSLSSP